MTVGSNIVEKVMGKKASILLTLILLYCLQQYMMTRTKDEWKNDVLGRFKGMEGMTKESARMQFLRVLQTLPYGVCCW